jgi:hypothetical protein
MRFIMIPLMWLRSRFLNDEFRLPIFWSATPLLKRGQRRLSSANRQSKIGIRQFIANHLSYMSLTRKHVRSVVVRN